MKIFLWVLLINVSFIYKSIAQNRIDVNVGSEFKIMITDLDSCIKSGDKDCSKIADEIIQKGKQEKVAFLDYLYFKKAFYFMNRNGLDSAYFYAKLALAHPHPEEKFRTDIDAYNIIANYFYYKGNLDSAIHNYLQVAKVLENGGNQLHLGYLYSNIATLLGETENTKGQLEFLHKSFNLLEENKDERFIATVASNLALGYYYNKDTNNVIKWADKALELATISNDLVAKHQATMSLSLVQTDLNNALEYAAQSLKYADELNDKIYMATSNYRYADVLHKLGQQDKALLFSEKAIQYAKSAGDNVTLMKSSYTAATISYNLGMKNKAADYYHTYAMFKDSVASVENAKAINELTTQYETEKKERQLAEQQLVIQKKNEQIRNWLIAGGLLLLGVIFFVIQNKRNQQRKIKLIQQENENAVLKAMMNGEEQERNRISKDLHDGVAAILGAAKMSLQAIPYLPEEKKKEHFEKVSHLIDNTHNEVRRIAHDLLPITLEKEGLIVAVHQFASDLNQMGLLELQIDNQLSSDFGLPQRTELMLYRIIQELINNIIKHSQASKAKISFAYIENKLTINVEDNGIGFDEKKESQGLYSIKERLKALGGTFNIKGEKNMGTKVSLILR